MLTYVFLTSLPYSLPPSLPLPYFHLFFLCSPSPDDFADGTDFIFTFKDVVITNEVSIRSRIISSGETLNFHPIDIIKDGRYELDEVIKVDLFPAEGESSVQTGPPATIIIEDSDGK